MSEITRTMSINKTIEKIVNEISEAYELDEEGKKSISELITPHIKEMAEELKGSEEESQTQALLQKLLAQQKGGEGKTVTKRRASGWNAYASAMRKEHGWDYKAVKENAPWGGLSDEEKEKWNKIAQENQEKTVGRKSPGSVKVKKVNPWNEFIKKYKAGLPEGVKYDVKECSAAYKEMKAQEGSA